MKGMLSCSSLIENVRQSFSRIKESTKRVRSISLVDNLMSGFAVFSLKYPSLLQFDMQTKEQMIANNIHAGAFPFCRPIIPLPNRLNKPCF